jgi:RNA polymerase sigma factor (sigma-70 family)
MELPELHTGSTPASLTVMIADEQEIFRHGLGSLLTSLAGFTMVAEASSFQEIVEQLTTMPVDVLFVDASLFGSQGANAVLKLKEIAPQTQCVIMAGSLDGELLVESMLLGASGYMVKNLPRTRAIEAITALQIGAFALPPLAAKLLVRQLVQRIAWLQTEALTHQQDGQAMQTQAQHEAVIASKSLENLTPQELRVFRLMHQGMSNKQIAVELHISPYTVGKHIQQILRKLGAANRTQAASYTSIEVERIKVR